MLCCVRGQGQNHLLSPTERPRPSVRPFGLSAASEDGGDLLLFDPRSIIQRKMCFLLQEIGPEGMVGIWIFLATIVCLLIAILIAIGYRMKNIVERRKKSKTTNGTNNVP